MYFIFGIIFLILLLLVCINYRRKKKIIHKVCSMCDHEKYALLNRLLEPLGYSFVPAQGLVTSRRNAWQRDFGYRALYDRIHPGMVFDCLPVYFDYAGKTWLIELWKGQYGICSGCEIGVYRSDRILAKGERRLAHFNCANDDEMPRLSFILWEGQRILARMRARHWWLTGFLIGHFAWPASLTLYTSVALCSSEMAAAFYRGLLETGFSPDDVTFCGRTVSFTFRCAPEPCGFFAGLCDSFAMCANRIGCRLFLFVTRPFCLTADRVLYLYFYLPFAFRRMLRIHRYKEKHRRRRPA